MFPQISQSLIQGEGVGGVSASLVSQPMPQKGLGSGCLPSSAGCQHLALICRECLLLGDFLFSFPVVHNGAYSWEKAGVWLSPNFILLLRSIKASWETHKELLIFFRSLPFLHLPGWTKVLLDPVASLGSMSTPPFQGSSFSTMHIGWFMSIRIHNTSASKVGGLTGVAEPIHLACDPVWP